MKNKKSIILALMLLFTMCFSMFGCGPKPDRYNIVTNVWYSNYGTSYGGGTYDEGSTVTISALPKQDSQFMAWMKDNVIVSYDQEYSFEINSETTGTYTAIFNCPELELITLKRISFLDMYDEGSISFTTLNVDFYIGGSYKNLKQFFSTEITNKTEFDITDITFALNARNKIPAKVVLTYTTKTVIDGEETEIKLIQETLFKFEIDLNAETLVSDLCNLRLPSGILGEANVQFLFETLTVPEKQPEEE